MNQSLWPVALVGGIVCAYLPIGSADTFAVPEPVAVTAPELRVAAAQPEKDPAAAPAASGAPGTTRTTTTSRLPTAEEARAALERGTEKAVAAGRRAGDSVKREWQRFERAHPEATRRTTTTISTGDAKTPLVIRQQAASQP